MTLIILNVLFVVISFQLLFVAVFLFQSKKGQSFSNYLLATVFLLLGTSVVTMGLFISGYLDSFPLLVLIDDSFILAYGPLLLLFTDSVLIKDFQLQRKQAIHFLPFLALTIFVIITLGFSSTSIQQSQSAYFKVGEILLLVHAAIYVVSARLKIKRVVAKAVDRYSDLPIEHVSWLKLIVSSFILLLITALIHAVIPILNDQRGLVLSLSLFALFLFYFVNRLIFKILNDATGESGIIASIEQRSKEKYHGTLLSDSILAEHKTKIIAYMTEEQPYLQSQLTLKQFAEHIQIASRSVSQVINMGFSQNFFDFVNQHRIEHAKRLLQNSEQDLTIQEVMYSSGFNTKSSFNTAFKKFTGQTPSSFRKRIKKGTTS